MEEAWILEMPVFVRALELYYTLVPYQLLLFFYFAVANYLFKSVQAVQSKGHTPYAVSIQVRKRHVDNSHLVSN